MILAALGVLETILRDGPVMYEDVAGLIALIKRGVSGGPEPTEAEILANADVTKMALDRIRADIAAGDKPTLPL